MRRRTPGLERAPQHVRRGPAVLRVLLQAAHHGRGEILGAVGTLVGHRRRALGDLLHQDAGHRRCLERQLADQHLVGNDPEAVEVRAAVDLPVARGLLGTHVVRRPDGHAGRGERRSSRRGGEGLGDPEVGDDDPAAAALQQDVVRLHVPVDDSERVRGAEGVGRFHHDAARFLGRKAPAALQLRPQPLAFHVRHDEVDEAVGALADRMDGDDVGMRQTRRRLRLTQKAGADLFTEGELRGQHLDRHAPFEPLVAGVVHHPHAAPADLSLERVRGAQCLAQTGGERLVGFVHAAPGKPRRIDLAPRGEPGNCQLRRGLLDRPVAAAVAA